MMFNVVTKLTLFPAVSAGVACSNECDDEIMCWGTGADKCVSCRNYLYQPNNTCVYSCDNVSTIQAPSSNAELYRGTD